MSASVSLNLLKKFRKRHKMRGLPRILSLYCNEVNKFNNTGARMLYSIYHDIKFNVKSYFWRENVKVLLYFMQCSIICHYVSLLNL